MKFLVGVILSAIITSLLFIGAWFYFDFPIDTNDESEKYNPPLEVQQQKYNDHIEEQREPQTEQQEVEENPTVYSEGGYETKLHNFAGTNNYEYAKEHGLIEEEQ